MAFFTTVKAEIPFLPSCFDSLDNYDDDSSEDDSCSVDDSCLEAAAAATAAAPSAGESRNSTLKHGEVLPSSSSSQPPKTSPVTVTVNGQVQNFGACDDVADDVTAAETSSGCSTPTPSAYSPNVAAAGSSEPATQQKPSSSSYQERFDYEIDPDIGVIV